MNKYIKNDDQLTCFLGGKFDTQNSALLENEINQNMKEDITSVIFDLREVGYVSSAFLRIVMKIVKKLGRENFILSNVQPSVMKVFKMANFTDIVKFE